MQKIPYFPLLMFFFVFFLEGEGGDGGTTLGN